MLAQKLLSSTAGSAEKLYADDVFTAYLRTGTGADVTVTTGIDMTRGYMLWSKGRSGATDHAVYDSARGVTLDLVTNSTAAQTTQTTGLKSVSTTGHTIGSLAKMNTSGATYVDWVFRNADKFFTHTTISHTNGTATNINLSALGIVGYVHAKITNTTGDWIVWHRSLTAGNNLRLNTTAAESTTNAWLSVSGTTATLSASAPTGTYVVHAFAHDTASDGIIQCGSFTTNAAGDGNVTIGWEPQFVWHKSSSIGDDWMIFDSIRGMTATGFGAKLGANNLLAENTNSFTCKPNATGFTTTDGLDANSTFIYLAIRRPNKPPTSGTQVYNAIARTGTGAAETVTGVGFAPDFFQISARPSISGKNWVQVNRLAGGGRLLSSDNTGAEVTNSAIIQSDSLSTTMDGIRIQTANPVNSSATTYINHFFRRAPGVHDQICYNGTGSNKTETHNLAAIAELWLVKRRDVSSSWTFGSSLLNATEKIVMPSPNGRVTDTTAWNSTYPTATQISLGTQADVNASGGTYVAYMWASLAGISKVISYTGNGTSQTINCGFTTGARFVMVIRATASTAQDIYIWDSARGITSGNDPGLSLNTTAAEVTTLDSVDPDASGFIVNQDASNINVNGAVYIALAYA